MVEENRGTLRKLLIFINGDNIDEEGELNCRQTVSLICRGTDLWGQYYKIKRRQRIDVY